MAVKTFLSYVKIEPKDDCEFEGLFNLDYIAREDGYEVPRLLCVSGEQPEIISANVRTLVLKAPGWQKVPGKVAINQNERVFADLIHDTLVAISGDDAQLKTRYLASISDCKPV